jgi:hypothetical protein
LAALQRSRIIPRKPADELVRSAAEVEKAGQRVTLVQHLHLLIDWLAAPVAD